MVTTEQAKEALENVYDGIEYNSMASLEASYYVLQEFINQYSDMLKVKSLPYLLVKKEK